jgi:Questin oxidase-like
MSADSHQVMEDALLLLRPLGFESRAAGANHAPMVADALCALGRADAVIPWIERYKPRLEGERSRNRPISQNDWRESLGHFSQAADWTALFNNELESQPWAQVLNKWVPRLAPGLAAAAFHGLLRSAHAVRSLEHGVTPLRLEELGRGLAYWAARYQHLPELEDRESDLSPAQALGQLPTLPLQNLLSLKPPDMATGLFLVSALPSFKSVANLVKTSGDQAGFLSDLTESSAISFLENPNGFSAAVAFLHSVTGPAAVRLLLPHLHANTHQILLRYCWQTVAGLYVAFGPTPRVSEEQEGTLDPLTLCDRAVSVGLSTSDPHAIKFIEACAREYRLRPSPAYFAAAASAVEILQKNPT